MRRLSVRECAGLCGRAGIQDLLDTPNPLSPAQSDAFTMFTGDRGAYDKRVKQQALQYPPSTG